MLKLAKFEQTRMVGQPMALTLGFIAGAGQGGCHGGHLGVWNTTFHSWYVFSKNG